VAGEWNNAERLVDFIGEEVSISCLTPPITVNQPTLNGMLMHFLAKFRMRRS
jgi:hypothetical protein